MDEVHLIGKFTSPLWFDLFATFLFALTGSIIAIEKKYDFIGVFILALVSSTGGGIIRDILLQQGPPLALVNYKYLVAVISGGLAAILFHKYTHKLKLFIAIVDALSLGIYSTVGAVKTMQADLSPLAALFIGLIKAVGGGLIRDVLIREEPQIFKPSLFMGAAVVIGLIVFILLSTVLKINIGLAGIITIGVTFIIRLLAIRFNWRTRAIKHIEQ